MYYAMDCLAWNGMSLYDCTTEMRLSWLHSKLGESGPECEAANPPGVQHRYRFAMPPTRICDAEGLSAAYHAPVPFIRDGLLFVAKDGIFPFSFKHSRYQCSHCTNRATCMAVSSASYALTF